MSIQLSELVIRLQQGEHAAAAELLATYEPEVRRFIRVRMSSPQMRRLVETVDVSQSVFAKFFVDIRRDGVCPETPQQLRSLLLTMARNKICDHVRRHKAAKRDMFRVVAGEAAIESAYYDEPTPSEAMANKEAVEAVLAEMSDDERALVDARLGGRPWSDIATDLGVSPDAARKRFSRTIESVAQRVESYA